eukprot:s19_g12.t1
MASACTPDDGLQGASLPVVLSRLGQHWKQHAKIKGHVVSTEYYDNFLSHDWATSGHLKYLSLLILFNAKAAMVASILISVLVGVLRMMAILPNLVWTQLPCYTFYYVVLVFWQQIRAVIFSPRLVFLDRLCIPQDDEEKKSECIRGLASYLDRAQTLTVLWSERYFGRLWCVFELATFLRYRSERRIQVLPVEMSILTLLIGLSYSAFHLVHRVWDEARNLNSKSESETSPWITVLNGIGILAAVACLVVPFYNYLGLELAAKIRRLPAQLRMFDAREARCYCCSVDHVHPETKAPILCDRQLIWEKLSEWYGDPEDSKEAEAGINRAIEQFNHLVRKELADVFLDMMSGSDVLWQYIYLLIGMNGPVCAFTLGSLGFPPSSLEGWSLHAWRARYIIRFAHVFLQIAGSVQMFATLWTMGASPFRDYHRITAAVLLTPIPIIVTALFFFLPFRLCWELSADDSLLVLAPVIVEVLAIVAFSYTRRLVTEPFTRRALESGQQLHISKQARAPEAQDMSASRAINDDCFSI